MTDVAGGLISLEYALTGLKYKVTAYTEGQPLSARDADIAAYIKAATPIIEDKIGPVLRTADPLTVRRNGGKLGVLLPHRLQSAADVITVTEDDQAITDYVVDEDARIVYAGTSSAPRRFAPGRKNITVGYLTGWDPIPETIQLAARELVVTWVQQGNQAINPDFDDAGSGAPTPKTRMGFALPKRVIELLAPFWPTGGIG